MFRLDKDLHGTSSGPTGFLRSSFYTDHASLHPVDFAAQRQCGTEGVRWGDGVCETTLKALGLPLLAEL